MAVVLTSRPWYSKIQQFVLVLRVGVWKTFPYVGAFQVILELVRAEYLSKVKINGK